MERKSDPNVLPTVNGDMEEPDTGIASEQAQKAHQDQSATTPNEAQVEPSDAQLMNSKAFTESVQEEIKGENDALIVRSYTSDSKKLQAASSVEGIDVEMGEQEEAPEEESKVASQDPPAELHPLLSAWSFWYVYTISHRDKKKIKQARRNDYDLREVYSFETIEDFWHMYNNLYSVSEIISNTDYLLFKKGIRPEWEDPENKHGGKWVVTMPIEDDLEEDCENAWLQLILHMISGQFPKEQRNVINGAVFSIRDKHLRISVWCSVSKEIALLQAIGFKLREITQLDLAYKFGFQEHAKALKHDLDNQNFLEV